MPSCSIPAGSPPRAGTFIERIERRFRSRSRSSGPCVPESLQHRAAVSGACATASIALGGALSWGVRGRTGCMVRGPGGVPHAGGQGAGGGIEVLDLLRHVSLPVEPLRQLDTRPPSAAGGGRR